MEVAAGAEVAEGWLVLVDEGRGTTVPTLVAMNMPPDVVDVGWLAGFAVVVWTTAVVVGSGTEVVVGATDVWDTTDVVVGSADVTELALPPPEEPVKLPMVLALQAVAAVVQPSKRFATSEA